MADFMQWWHRKNGTAPFRGGEAVLRTHSRMAVLLGVGVFAITLGIWWAMVRAERSQVLRAADAEAEIFRSEVQEIVEPGVSALVRMARRWEVRGRMPRREWEADAGWYMAHQSPLDAILWMNIENGTSWVVSLDRGFVQPDLTTLLPNLIRVSPTNGASLTGPVALPGGGGTFAAVAPVSRDNTTYGAIIGFFDVTNVFGYAVRGRVAEMDVRPYTVAVFDGDVPVFSDHHLRQGRNRRWIRTIAIPIENVQWHVELWPTQEFLAAVTTPIPEVTLASGLLISALLFLSALLAGVARKATEIESVNRLLQKEIAERKGVEAKLRELNQTLEERVEARAGELVTRAGELEISNVRLSEQAQLIDTVLENSSDGIIVADENGQFLLYSKSAETITGVGLTDIRPENWQDHYGVFEPDGFTPVPLDKMPLMRAIGGERVEDAELFMRNPNIPDGVYVSVNASPLCNHAGEVKGGLVIIRDISERRKWEEVTAQKAEELARSNAELEQFAYVASHDLQEPLRMVASYTQLLERRYVGKLDDDADEFIQFIVDGVVRMQTLINDLLTLSRVNTKGWEPAPTDCQKVLDRVVFDLNPIIVENEAAIVYTGLPTVMGDETQITQLFQNLIANAIKFRNDKSPVVEIAAQRQNGSCAFTVRDNGIGMDPQYSERIFRMFQRLHTRREYRGTGIGLAVCKRIVERHGGRIWVESAIGQGSTFCFTIPATEGPDDTTVR